MNPNRHGKARNSVILPTSYTSSQSISIKCDEYGFVVFNIGYTRGGAGGAVSYKIEFSNNPDDSTSWAQGSFISSQSLAQGTDLKNWVQRVEQEYVATGDGLERFMTDSYIVSGEYVRLVLRESGNLGSPGIADADFFLNGVQ